ncbi:MAG: hypothetical protein NVS4B3_25980 [Gemmatimonadaceae bacterium]
MGSMALSGALWGARFGAVAGFRRGVRVGVRWGVRGALIIGVAGAPIEPAGLLIGFAGGYATSIVYNTVATASVAALSGGALGFAKGAYDCTAGL